MFELKETLTGKYGEDSKLIYELADQGGELLALRYDLTVPFARYLASHGISNIKRYHIARVYRRDQPGSFACASLSLSLPFPLARTPAPSTAMNKGRYREFYQCDYDIAGEYEAMVPEAEVLKVLCEVLDELNLGKFSIKLNHRALLDAILGLCGTIIPLGLAPKKHTQSSRDSRTQVALRTSFEPFAAQLTSSTRARGKRLALAFSSCAALHAFRSQVRREMVVDKGLDGAVADRIGTYVCLKSAAASARELVSRMKAEFSADKAALLALDELTSLFHYMDALGCTDKVHSCFSPP